MSATRDKDKFVIFECDTCGDVFDSEEKEFNSAVQAMRDEGWKYLGQSEHRCASCDQNEIPKNDPYEVFR